jgi:hypothetical protein
VIYRVHGRGGRCHPAAGLLRLDTEAGEVSVTLPSGLLAALRGGEAVELELARRDAAADSGRQGPYRAPAKSSWATPTETPATLIRREHRLTLWKGLRFPSTSDPARGAE